MNLLMHDIIKMKDHDYRWIGSLYKRGKKVIRFITNHRMTHFIFLNHSKLELLNIAKTKFASYYLKIAMTRFVSYYLTFRCMLKVRETLASMVSSDPWQDLKRRVTSTSDRNGFQEVEDTILDDHFWQQVRCIMQSILPSDGLGLSSNCL
jgi:hypothetical protein